MAKKNFTSPAFRTVKKYKFFTSPAFRTVKKNINFYKSRFPNGQKIYKFYKSSFPNSQKKFFYLKILCPLKWVVDLAIPVRHGSQAPPASGDIFWMNQAIFWACSIFEILKKLWENLEILWNFYKSSFPNGQKIYKFLQVQISERSKKIFTSPDFRT